MTAETSASAVTGSVPPDRLGKLGQLLALGLIVGTLAVTALLFIGTPMRPFVSQGNVVDGWAIKGEPLTGDECAPLSCEARIVLAARALPAGAAPVIAAAVYAEDRPAHWGGIGRGSPSGVVVLRLADGSQRALGIVCWNDTCEINSSKPADPLYRNSGGIQP